MSQRNVPITRLGKFFGGEDFALDVSIGREWLEGDMNFTLVLYKKVQKQLGLINSYTLSPYVKYGKYFKIKL